MPEMLPESMMAIGFDAPGGSEVLRSELLPLPQPGPGEVFDLGTQVIPLPAPAFVA